MSGDNKNAGTGVDGCGSIQGSQVVISAGNSGGGAGGIGFDPKNHGELVIDGKIVTREDVRKLQSELDALAATVAALREVANHYQFKIVASDNAMDEIVARLGNTPQQHLRDVRAEAVIDAIKSGVVVNCIGTNCISVRGLKQYAERILQEKK